MIVPLNIPVHEFFNDEELVAFSIANPELVIERDERGQLFINMTPTFAISSSNNSELITELGIWNRKYKAGKVLESNGGYFLADSSMRVPDVAWIKLDRWKALSMAEKKSFPHLAPDFIIELKSETDSLTDLQAKMIKWVENGVRLAWLICTDQQLTYIYTPDSPVSTITFDEILSGAEVLTDFSVRLGDILEY
ncbi:Uma2 family endonuclease [Dyadobacter luticola]|uniref:Uma2 family endonuclease n=1 Tax=Dyadobacter luticola TaxID=1979387 RepID=A0A5R9KVH4_9BACT|nr:Uma2 family endonuclease [Dyadobacter luticola]TLV00241.1 Uma2 family endonuclease [Dyadobacter luticola]